MPDRPSLAGRLLAPLLGMDLAALLLIVQVDGYNLHTRGLDLLLLAALGLAVLLSIARDLAELHAALGRWSQLKRQLLDWILLGVCAALPSLEVHGPALHLALILRQAVHALRLVARTRYGAAAIAYLSRKPAQLMLLSFALTILLGALFLTFPLATSDGRGASFVDALFTAASATCVTGLTVQDTATYFTLFGQLVILSLIQVGGLGIMTLSGSAAILLGRHLGIRSRSLLAESMELADVAALRELMIYVVKITFLIELAGAALLLLGFLPGRTLGAAAYAAVFHSISAFCNAGFSTFSDNLVGFRGDLLVNAAITGLIIAGGLGFTVLHALTARETGHRSRLGRWERWSVHVKLVLPGTALLLGLGTIGYYFLEFGSTLAGLPLGEKLLGAWFQSVTARTAGFNTVDIGKLEGPGLMLIVMLMFIGAAPGSCAGGIKVTTAAVLLLAVRAMLLGGGHEVEIYGRTLPREVVYKAIAITVISFLLVVAVFSCLLWTEGGRFEVLLFETVSAFGTVGLSMNYSPSLTQQGKLAITGLMYAGRTGPLTLALAIGERESSGQYRTPTESVMVG